MSNTYIKHDVRIFDKFIDKFARKYIEQRSASKIPDIDDILLTAENLGSGFDLSQIKSVIQRNSVAVDPVRESGQTPQAVKNKKRSDLGELLTTYYFKEKLDEKDRFKKKKKNM